MTSQQLRVAAIIGIAVLMLGVWIYRQASLPDGLVEVDPEQTDVESDVPPWKVGSYTIHPMARYRIEAMVLSRKHYQTGREADLSKVDLALGWGPMSNTQVLGQLTIMQRHRRYEYCWQDDPPIREAAISSYSANVHCIAANGLVLDELMALKGGEIVLLEGFLVNVTAPDGWRWESSLTRDDSGSGSCEVMWVSSIEVRDR